jgi:4-hydroxy 2-oxovalerate aldolase
MELGYKATRKGIVAGEYGAWKYCLEEDIRRIVDDNPTPLKLSVMADAERCDYRTDIAPKKDSVIDLVRVATYIHQVPTALDMVKDAHDKGYETSVNLMAVSTVPGPELEEGLELLAESEARAIYVVDSYGSLYSEQVQYLVKKYLHYCKPAGKEVGIHAHNNLQLAFANTIEAIVLGANMLDATMAGLGRGAGNCFMELLIGFLHNPKYDIRPVLRCVQDTIEPLREKLGWGFDLPYMIVGQFNQHPRAAIKYNDAEKREDIVKFFDTVSE